MDRPRWAKSVSRSSGTNDAYGTRWRYPPLGSNTVASVRAGGEVSVWTSRKTVENGATSSITVIVRASPH